MSHLRSEIRDAVVDRLIAAGTAAGAKVYGNRAAQIFPDELPVILVYTRNEPVELANESPREYKRNLVINIECVANAASEASLDDALDDLAAEVEEAIFEDETFDGLVSDTILGETEMDILTEGEKPIGAAKISLTMPYFQRLPGDRTGDLDDLQRVNTKIDLPPADEEIESEDRQTLEILP